MNLSMFSCIHFLSNRKQRAISKRVVKKDSSQELSDQTSPVNQELDQSGVLVRSWKLLRDTNQNPTMNCQERQQEDAQSFSTWKQGRRDESSKLSPRQETQRAKGG